MALSGALVEAVASGDEKALEKVAKAIAALPPPFAVREVWRSANSDSAIIDRQRVGLFTRPTVGVVVQTLLDPAVAGVMFTEHPVTGADERLIEASRGLGEAVVAGLVVPDQYRLDRSGQVLERKTGRKRSAIRSLPNGGTFEQRVPAAKVTQLCLDDAQLAALGELALRCVQLSAEMDRRQAEQIARLLKERPFAKGETVIMEGSGGAAFFLIASGEATVSRKGVVLGPLGPGDHFGEIALIDGGPRSATVTAATDLVCCGLTFWKFRPLIERNGTIGWKLLHAPAKRLRAAEPS